MKSVFLLALNGVKEVIRHKFFYGLAFIALFIIAIGLILGPLSMTEQQRITINLSLFGTQIVLIAVCVFFGSLSITRDLEKKILITLISKPISRSLYIIGKFCGIALISALALLIIGVLIGILFYYFDVPINALFFKAMWGIYLEALVLLSISVFLSSFTSPFLIVCFSFGVFIIGHWIDTARLLLMKADGLIIHFFSKYVILIFPNLEKFNWRTHVVYQDILPIEEVGFYTFYAFSWVVFILAVAIHIFNRKDFV